MRDFIIFTIQNGVSSDYVSSARTSPPIHSPQRCTLQEECSARWGWICYIFVWGLFFKAEKLWRLVLLPIVGIITRPFAGQEKATKTLTNDTTNRSNSTKIAIPASRIFGSACWTESQLTAQWPVMGIMKVRSIHPMASLCWAEMTWSEITN